MSIFGFSDGSTPFTPADRALLIRIEQKLDLLLGYLGIADPPPPATGLSPAVQALALDPNNKIQAIAQYRAETGASLAQAKAAVERFIATGQ